MTTRGVVLAIVASVGFMFIESARAEGLVEEVVDESQVQAEADYRAAIRATRAGNNALALTLFERAMPKKRTTPDLFYNLVQVARLEKHLGKVVVYAQAFRLLESEGKDADLLGRQLDAARATLAARGRPVVACSVRVPEGATILVDGAPVGDHARPGFELAPGTYLLRVERADHEPHVEELVVGADPITRYVSPVRIVYRGKVKILSKPAAGVRVLVDGVEAGVTPLSEPLDLEAGKRILLRFEKDGFDAWVRYVELGKGETLELAPVLEKSAP